VPEDFQAWKPDDACRPRRPQTAARREPRRGSAGGWRQNEIGDQVVAEVARQAAVRRAARAASRQRLFGRLRLSAPRPPKWLELWSGLVLPVRLGSAALVLVLVAAIAALNLPWLTVQRVHVEGTSAVGRSRLLAAAGIKIGESTIMLNTERMTLDLMEQPWVASASVVVHWPGTVVVSVTPLPPALLYERGKDQQLLSQTGAVLGQPVALPPNAYPTLVDQRSGAPVGEGHVAIPAHLAGALAALAKAFPAAYGVSVSQFLISPVGALEIKSSAGWVADLGPALTNSQIASMGPKLEALRNVAAKVNLKSSTVKDIYLEDPSQVVVSP
jgi:cell division septal protein FtsQ